MIKCINKYIKPSIQILIGASLIACNSGDYDTATLGEATYDNKISEPEIKIYQENNKVIYATAHMLLKDEGKDAILIGDVISKFFNDSGLHISTLYSDSAIVESFSNNLKAFGNVKVISDSGYTLFSDKIYWNNQYKLVTSDDSVMFTNSFKDTMYGIGFESDIDLTHSKIFKPFGIVKERKK
tara:strand:- start:682 stop:1230 length:549 start_codon:yes stop_codon:yes gene_type:complete